MLALLRAPSTKFLSFNCSVFISINGVLNSYLPIGLPVHNQTLPRPGPLCARLGYATAYVCSEGSCAALWMRTQTLTEVQNSSNVCTAKRSLYTCLNAIYTAVYELTHRRGKFELCCAEIRMASASSLAKRVCTTAESMRWPWRSRLMHNALIPNDLIHNIR